MTSRRTFLAAALVLAAPGLAGGQTGRNEDAFAAELLNPGPLADIWLGPPDARVTVIEYASLTCSHCARFHRTTWPELKARYVDKGLVRFTLRPFPLDPVSVVAFMMIRSKPERYYELVDLLFESQETWAYVPRPFDALRERLRGADFTQESFDEVLRDQDLLVGVGDVKTRAAEIFKVDATPTFFINGRHRQGTISIEDFEGIIEPILGARKL